MRTPWARLVSGLVLTVFSFCLLASPVWAQQATTPTTTTTTDSNNGVTAAQDDIDSVLEDRPFYAGVSAYGCVSGDLYTGVNSDVSTTEAQVAIIKTILGVVKTEGLDKDAALISLIVAIDESGLKIYANSGVPLSLGNPAKQAVGHDHDSLGVFQQRITAGWSTISSDINNKDAVYQLMDPAYNIEAFLGSPPGVHAPPALSKGLQNRTNWHEMNPWTAAQKVQVSGTKDGSNYKRFIPQAQAMLDQYWDSATPVPLPVPLDSGGSGGQNTSDSGDGTDSGCTITDGSLGEALAKKAIEYSVGSTGAVANPAFTKAMQHFTQITHLSPPSGGKDCGFFVATAVRDSGVYPVNAGTSGPDYPYFGTYDMLPYMQSHPQSFQSVPNLQNTSNLQPGDIFIILGDPGHTFIYLGDLAPGGYNMASASGGHTEPHLGHIYFHDDRGDYKIFRLISSQ